MQARKVLETCLYVDDLSEAEAFYTQVLGLKCFARVQGRHAFFRLEDAVFLLFNPVSTRISTNPGIPTHGAMGEGHAAFAMPVEDIDRWRSHLSQHEIEIESDYTWPGGGISLYFRDPSGNSIELTTPKTWNL